jgi:hypothetical protein
MKLSTNLILKGKKMKKNFKLISKLITLSLLFGGLMVFSSNERVSASVSCDTVYSECVYLNGPGLACDNEYEECILNGGEGSGPPASPEFCDQARADAANCQAWYGVPLHGTNPNADPDLYAACMTASGIDRCQ